MIVSEFQFKKPVLTKMHFDTNPNCMENGKTVFENRLDIDVKRKEDAPSALVTINLFIKSKDDDAPFSIECAMSSEFQWNKDAFDENTINGLLKINAPSLLLGYLRPIVSQITNLSQFPSYDIPFYNFIDSDENEEQ